MTDDRQHEYVPPVARDILDGQRIAAVAAYAEAKRKAYNLQILYDNAMVMLSAMTAERDAARQSRKRAVCQSQTWKTAAYLRWADARTAQAQLDVCREGLAEAEAERALSQQMREDDLK